MTAHKPGGSGSGVFVGASPPASPGDGQLWWDTDDTSAVGGSQPVQKAEVTLEPADILALHDTPFVLVPGQGSETVVVPIHVAQRLVFRTTPYTNAGAVELNLGAVTLRNDLSPIFAGSNSRMEGQDIRDWGGYDTIADVGDGDLTLSIGSANPENGDGDLIVSVVYYVSPAP